MFFSIGWFVVKAAVSLLGLFVVLWIIILPFTLVSGAIRTVKKKRYVANKQTARAKHKALMEAKEREFKRKHPESDVLTWHFQIELEQKLNVIRKGFIFPAKFDAEYESMNRPNTYVELGNAHYEMTFSQILGNTLVMFFEKEMVMRVDLPFKLKSRYIFGKMDLHGNTYDLAKNLVR